MQALNDAADFFASEATSDSVRYHNARALGGWAPVRFEEGAKVIFKMCSRFESLQAAAQESQALMALRQLGAGSLNIKFRAK